MNKYFAQNATIACKWCGIHLLTAICSRITAIVDISSGSVEFSISEWMTSMQRVLYAKSAISSLFEPHTAFDITHKAFVT